MDSRTAFTSNKDLPGLTFLFAFYVILTSSFNANPDNMTPASQELLNTIARLDSTVFATLPEYNSAKSRTFFTDDLEVYNDTEGLLKSRNVFIEAPEKNFYKTQKENVIRRELVEGSMKVYPLKNNGAIYGAVQTGEQCFYELRKGKEERLTGTSKFTHIWLNKNGEWKISRMIIYNHHSAM